MIWPPTHANRHISPGYYGDERAAEVSEVFTPWKYRQPRRVCSSFRKDVANDTAKDTAMNQLRATTFASLLALFAAACPLHAGADEAGVSADTILFGQVAALEGPSSALGQGMRQGILAAFNEVNAKGGVHGRKLVGGARLVYAGHQDLPGMETGAGGEVDSQGS